MKLSENETNLAILNFKLRIYVGFVLSIVLTIAFIVCSITFYSKGRSSSRAGAGRPPEPGAGS